MFHNKNQYQDILYIYIQRNPPTGFSEHLHVGDLF